MKFVIIISLIFHLPLFSGEWNYLSNLPKDLDRPFIEVISQSNIMIGGNLGLNSPCVEKSTNSAKSFEVIFKDTVSTNLFGFSREIVTFHHNSPNHIFIMCYGSRFWYSDNGGSTWDYDSLLSNSNSFTETNSFKNFVITMLNNKIFISYNYGKNWESFDFNLKHSFNLEKGRVTASNFTYLNDSTIIANGYYFVDFYHKDNVYFHTISYDYGRSWVISSLKERFETFFYHKLSGNSIYAVGSIQTAPYSNKEIDLFRLSTDGGYTWQNIMDTLSTPTLPLLSVEFLDDKKGIAFTRGFVKLWRTNDGGLSWYRDNGPDDFAVPPSDYAFLPNGEILSVSINGEIHKWTDPILSIEEDRIQKPEQTAKIYPNPLSINETLNVEFIPSFLGEVELSIIDMTGRKISTYKLTLVNSKRQILNFKPDNDLTTGVYFFQIGYNNGIAERYKFVVE